jgi:hypothetical protein
LATTREPALAKSDTNLRLGQNTSQESTSMRDSWLKKTCAADVYVTVFAMLHAL